MKVPGVLSLFVFATTMESASGRLAVAGTTRAGVATFGRPIAKVITLLKDMQAQLEKEAEEDETVNEKMTCWCETNDREKTKAVGDHETFIQDTLTVIEMTAAGSARLRQEIESHQKDLAKSQSSLDSATAIRERQAEDFHGEEKDMIQSIKALDAAIVVLSRHYQSGTALLDQTGVVEKALVVAKSEMQRHRALLQGSITPRQKRLVFALQQPSYASSTPTFRQAYQPQSSEIFGILKQMKETFEANLAEAQKEEAESHKAYDALKAAKMDEIAATQGGIQQKQVQLAESDEKHAQAKQDLEDRKVQLVNDNGFLITVKEKCQKSKDEYETRSKLRQEEISAVVQAISLLSTEEAHDTFAKSFGPALLQVGEHQRGDPRRSRGDAAAKLLQAAGSKAQNPRLIALATAARLDPFTKVKAAIDKMITDLVQEKKDEIQHKDSCITELNENEKLTELEERTKSDLQSAVEGLELTTTDLTSAIEVLNGEVAELQVQIKRRGEDRELQNKNFQDTVADHRETQKLLQKALAVLKVIYAKQAAVVVTTTSEPLLLQAVQPTVVPPAEFSDYKKSEASGGVVALLEQILSDAVAMEKEVVRDEQTSQEAYEAFVKETNLSIEGKRRSIVDKTEAKAKAEQDLLNKKADIQNSVKELEQLANTAGALHMSCDFVLKNFEIRQDARDQEVEALRQAKAVLSGMQLD